MRAWFTFFVVTSLFGIDYRYDGSTMNNILFQVRFRFAIHTKYLHGFFIYMFYCLTFSSSKLEFYLVCYDTSTPLVNLNTRIVICKRRKTKNGISQT